MSSISAQMILALAAIDEALDLPADGCNSTARTLNAIRELRASTLPDCRTCVHAVALHTLHAPGYICGLSSPRVCVNGDAYARMPVLRLYQRDAK